MYEIFIHNETHKKVYLKSNKSAGAAPKQLTLKYIFNTFVSVFMYLSLLFPMPTALSHFKGGQYVRPFNRITFEGAAMANNPGYFKEESQTLFFLVITV